MTQLVFETVMMPLRTWINFHQDFLIDKNQKE